MSLVVWKKGKVKALIGKIRSDMLGSRRRISGHVCVTISIDHPCLWSLGIYPFFQHPHLLGIAEEEVEAKMNSFNRLFLQKMISFVGAFPFLALVHIEDIVADFHHTVHIVGWTTVVILNSVVIFDQLVDDQGKSAGPAPELGHRRTGISGFSTMARQELSSCRRSARPDIFCWHLTGSPAPALRSPGPASFVLVVGKHIEWEHHILLYGQAVEEGGTLEQYADFFPDLGFLVRPSG